MHTPLVVAVTGHRDIAPAEIPLIESRIREFFAQLSAECPGLPIRLVSPLAEGAGRVAARVALDLDIALTIPLPIPRNLYLEDFQSDASLREFDDLCSRGDVIELPLLNGSSVDTVLLEAAARTRQYAQLGVFLSSHCQVLLAIWDGIELGLLGGTSQVVQFHLTDAMPGFIERSLGSPQLLAGNENDLVYHVVCSRERSPGVTAADLRPGDAGFYTASSYLHLTPQMPAAYRRMFHQMASFNSDVSQEIDSAERESLISGSAAASFNAAARIINSCFMRVNQLAKRYRARVYFSLRAIYTLAVLLGISFLTYSDFDNMEFMIWLFLSFFSAGVALYLVAQRLD